MNSNSHGGGAAVRAIANKPMLLAAATLFAGGCTCTDKCTPPRGMQAAVAPSRDSAASLDVTTSQIPLPIPSPATATVGAVMSGLKDVIGELSHLAETVGGEAKSAIQQAQQSASQLVSELDHKFGERQAKLVRDLDAAERRTLEDAIHVIEHSRRAAEQIAEGAFQNARETLYETDIVAYNAIHDLPCGKKAPRLVYGKPLQFRIWKDSNLAVDPSAGNGTFNPAERKEAYITVRGNYLAFGQPAVTVRVGSGASHSAQITGLNHNGFVAIVPPAAMEELEQIPRPTPLEVKASIPSCPKAGGGPVESQAVPITVLPSLTYDVAATIRPWAELPTFGSTNTGFSESTGCDDRPIDKTQTFSVGPPALVVGWALSLRSLNGNSSVSPPQRSGDYSVKVPARLAGKGKTWYGECKGRGWIDYTLRIDWKTYAATALLASTQTRRISSTQTDYLFDYPHQFPADYRDLQCKYYVRVKIDEGEQTVSDVELNEINPNATTPFGPIATRTDIQTCKVTVTVPAALRVARLGGRS